ncbi:MAG: GNAT family N-acetyltransferase [Epulopiscium sp.]|nr:GNAT family N-acetyltransferase [Candidatus Epulonipiscium sp.]
MNWHIKRFNDLSNEELYRILQLRNQVFIIEQNCPYLDCDEKDFNAHHLFLEDEGQIAAYARILGKGVNYEEMCISRVVVNPIYRRQKLGVQLMTQAINFIENHFKETSIRISGQAYLLDFYQDLGFKRVSDEYLEDNIPHFEFLYKKRGC